MQHDLPLPLQQHSNFAAALRLMGRETYPLEIEGTAPIQTIKRYGLRFASRGPVWQDARSCDSGPLRRSGLGLINSNGGDAPVLRRAGFRQILTPGSIAELSLAGSDSERLARMKGKWRNSLRRAQRDPLTLQREQFDPVRHHWLLQADTLQQRKKRFRSLPHSVLEAYAAANPGEALLWVARQKAEPVAAMLYLAHHPVVTYHLGWTSAFGRARGAHHLILTRAGNYFAQRGFSRIDLGEVDTENAPGLARFKIGTGAAIRQLGGTWLRLPGL